MPLAAMNLIISKSAISLSATPKASDNGEEGTILGLVTVFAFLFSFRTTYQQNTYAKVY
jgi:hypothetical protein